MGAPKQKWTAAEEAALIAGIAKHGAGKWIMILKDPEFCAVLHMRSNIDLKDKWRNINVASSGFGSRSRSMLKLQNSQSPPIRDDNSATLDGGTEIDEAKALEMPNEALPNAGSRKPISRLEDHLLEAITNLNEPRGSNRAAIAREIEGQYFVPPNLEKLLAANLRLLRENGKLIKVKSQYRIAPSSLSLSEEKAPSSLLLDGKKDSPMVDINGLKEDPPRAETNGVKLDPLRSETNGIKVEILTKPHTGKHQNRVAPPSTLLFDVKKYPSSSLVPDGKTDNPPTEEEEEDKCLSQTRAQIDAELEMMKHMTPAEQAAYAARTVAEAEACIALAEEAEREAVEAEREARAALLIAEEEKEPLKRLKRRKKLHI